jgi:hypothetical protein
LRLTHIRLEAEEYCSADQFSENLHTISRIRAQAE